jgi:hypothetical protein
MARATKSFKMIEITKQEFLSHKVPKPITEAFTQEEAWFKHASLLGIVCHDKTDRDWSFVALSKKDYYGNDCDEYRPFDVGASHPSKELAQEALYKSFQTYEAEENKNDVAENLGYEFSRSDAVPEHFNSFFSWLTSPFQLQRTTISRTHQMREYARRELKHDFALLAIFPIQHNWAEAFSGDKEFDEKTNECDLPAPVCCFEFAISGRPVLVIANERKLGKELALYIQLPPTDNWAAGHEKTLKRGFRYYKPLSDIQKAILGLRTLQDLVHLNVKAACIALEAQVAETQIVRTPYKLNAARERRGKSLLPDYHIINLANRRHYAPVPEDLRGDKRQSPRLHFRRSHLRHYANYTVRVKWCLAGNVDLGFIDKDYKL